MLDDDVVFSDGECPNCGDQRLALNTDDLLECPECHIVCANTDGVVASVMPYLGIGKFRLDDGQLPEIVGIGFAKAKTGSCSAEDKNLS